MEYKINGKIYKSLAQVPKQFRALFADSDGDGIPDLFQKMSKMSPAAFDKFMADDVPQSEVSYNYSANGFSSSVTYSKSSSTKLVTAAGEKLFPEVPAFMPAPGNTADESGLRGFLEKMRSRHEHGFEGTSPAPGKSTEPGDHILLEPEEDEDFPLGTGAPLELEIMRETDDDEPGQDTMSNVDYSDMRLEVPAREDADIDGNARATRHLPKVINIPLEPAIITLICRCGFVRKTVPEDYEKGERCPECFRELHAVS